MRTAEGDSTERRVAVAGGEQTRREERRGAEQNVGEDEGAATSCAGVAQDGI